MEAPCPRCDCASAAGHGAHALQAMLAADDLDAALAQGLLDAFPCPGCADSCNTWLLAARDARRAALAARERHRARAARQLRRKAERESARRPVASPDAGGPALPAAAADALARALARAAARKPQ